MFNCTKCGLCCKKVKLIVESSPIFSDKESQFYFPYSWGENGTCEKLKGNMCSVYKDRPLICNVDKFADVLGVDKHEFFKQTEDYCKTLQNEEGY